MEIKVEYEVQISDGPDFEVEYSDNADDVWCTLLMVLDEQIETLGEGYKDGLTSLETVIDYGQDMLKVKEDLERERERGSLPSGEFDLVTAEVTVVQHVQEIENAEFDDGGYTVATTDGVVLMQVTKTDLTK